MIYLGAGWWAPQKDKRIKVKHHTTVPTLHLKTLSDQLQKRKTFKTQEQVGAGCER